MASHVRHQRHSTRNHSPLHFLRHIPTPSAKNRSEPALPAVKFLPSIQPFDFADRGSEPIQYGISDETVFIIRALLSRMQALPSCHFLTLQTSYSPNIWNSHPLARLSGAGRTGVGHRRWAQQRTPALRPCNSPEEQHRPVCARHAVRSASLARRALRLTPEVNSGYLCPSAGLLTSPGAPER